MRVPAVRAALPSAGQARAGRGERAGCGCAVLMLLSLTDRSSALLA